MIDLQQVRLFHIQEIPTQARRTLNAAEFVECWLPGLLKREPGDRLDQSRFLCVLRCLQTVPPFATVAPFPLHDGASTCAKEIANESSPQPEDVRLP
jgi:hypothetical protein